MTFIDTRSVAKGEGKWRSTAALGGKLYGIPDRADTGCAILSLIFETINVRYCDKCIRERNRILPKFAMGWCKPLAYGWCIIALLIAIYTYLLVIERRGNFLLIDQWEKNESMLGHFSGRWKAGRDNLGNL